MPLLATHGGSGATTYMGIAQQDFMPPRAAKRTSLQANTIAERLWSLIAASPYKSSPSFLVRGAAVAQRTEPQAGVPMCFSPTASFVTVGITTAAAIACFTRIRRWCELPLASLPLIFAGQQSVEGFLWLTLPVDPDGPISSMLTLIFLLYAAVFWPAFAPMAALLMEPQSRRRRLMGVCCVIGAGVALYFLWSICTYPHAAIIRRGHIAYTGEPRTPATIGVLYLVATAVTPLLSSQLAVALLGVIVLGGSILAYAFYWEAFASLWCFFAARVAL
jgi:uncharacterized protein DUF6629